MKQLTNEKDDRMFNKKKLDHIWYPTLIVVAAIALTFVGYHAGGAGIQEDESAKNVAETTEENTAIDHLESGTYEVTGKGYNGDIVLSVTFKDNKITAIDIIEQDETPDIAEDALEGLPKDIIEANSTDVDAYSGATNTSNGIKGAVKKAIEEASSGATEKGTPNDDTDADSNASEDWEEG